VVQAVSDAWPFARFELNWNQKVHHLNICGKELTVQRGLIKVARIAEGYEFAENPDSLIVALREAGVRADLFTFIQRLSDTTPSFSYPIEWDNYATLRVSTYDHWFTRQIGNKTRNLIRKAEKSGVTVRALPFDDVLISGIARLNNETPIRQGRRFWHYGDDLETVRSKNGSFRERSVFLGAFFDGDLIGYIKLTSDDKQEQAGMMQIMSMIRHRDKAPTNLLVAHAVRSCAERSIRFLFYAHFSYRNKKLDSLAEFKRHNGFEPIEVPRYYVPLTYAGSIALRLGLHHGLANRLPESVLDRVRRLRNRWYEAEFRRARKPIA